VHVEAPSAGIVIYRFEESFLYPNSSFVNGQIIDYVKEHTRRGKAVTATKLGDRPWNDPGPRHAPDEASIKTALERPILHAIIFDFTSVSNLDTTAVQTLIDTRNEVERWADGPIEFHFATILSPWIRRALVAGGFGGANVDGARPSEIAPLDRRAQDHRDDFNTPRSQQIASDDIEQQQTSYGEQHQSSASYDTLVAADTPFFHFDLAGAVSAAEASRAGRSPGEKADDTATINSTGKR
jgi:sodium-independent sulfate anion transporter 11